ncbi:MAG: hypothetical protein DRN04_03965 [Thermoprotei archaeon]|nr:MAG: hypothetical protein DRN04_03965 [Thermoprotei archaeon]
MFLNKIKSILKGLLSFGEIIAGSSEEKRVVDFIKNRLEKYVSEINIQEVPVMNWREKYSIVEGKNIKIKSIALPYSLSFDEESTLIHITHIRDKKWKKACGKIVLVQIPPGDVDFVEDYYAKAVEVGAVGLIAYDSYPGVYRRIVVTGVKDYRWGCGEMPPPIPAVMVKKEDGLKLAKREGEKIRVLVETNVLSSTGYNIEGIIYGHSDEEVLLIAHHDHWLTGAADNCLGVSLLIAAAEQLKNSFLKRTIKLVSFTAEEAGAPCFSSYYWTWGSRYYVNSLESKKALSKIYAVVNVDVLAKGDVKLSVSGPDYMFLAEKLSGIKAEYDSSYMDSYAFSSKGVPALTLHTLDEYMQYYHTDKDVPENIDWSTVERGVSIALKILAELAKGLEIDYDKWTDLIESTAKRLDVPLPADLKRISREFSRSLLETTIYAYDEHYPDERPAFLKTHFLPELKALEDFKRLREAYIALKEGNLDKCIKIVSSIPLRIKLGSGGTLISLNTKCLLIFLEEKRISTALKLLENILSIEKEYKAELKKLFLRKIEEARMKIQYTEM